MDEDLSLLPVAHPAHDAQLMGAAQRRVPKADALDVATHDRAQRH
jgi:hypothetical protein